MDFFSRHGITHQLPCPRAEKGGHRPSEITDWFLLLGGAIRATECSLSHGSSLLFQEQGSTGFPLPLSPSPPPPSLRVSQPRRSLPSGFQPTRTRLSGREFTYVILRFVGFPQGSHAIVS